MTELKTDQVLDDIRSLLSSPAYSVGSDDEFCRGLLGVVEEAIAERKTNNKAPTELRIAVRELASRLGSL